MSTETHTPPRVTATLYTAKIGPDYFDEWTARGYVLDGKPWAVVDIGGLDLSAVGDDGFAGMQRLVDALQSAMARARQAQQDADLASVSS